MISILFNNGLLIDNLSLFFVFTILLISIPVFIYTFGYIKEYKDEYSRIYNVFLTTIFILSMLLVVLAKDSITFIVFWEIMSVSSFFLVIYEHKNFINIKNGIMYLIMTHISGFFLMTMFAFLYKYTGYVDFVGIAHRSNLVVGSKAIVVFVLALFGFGAKAGFMPLHAWLPKAHPSAPSNASALMSGLMLKVAIYGLIRVSFYFIGLVSLPFSLALVIIGVITAIYAILNAIVQKDIKKLLAYSSAENIGIIASVIGLSLVFKHYGMYDFALLAFVGAIFHILNHAVFKSLLFMSAGSVLFATGTKNMNELGGLYSKMKFASIAAFIGTLSISAIPPLNGFASEFLIFKNFIYGPKMINDIWVVVVLLFSGAIIALTSGGALFAAVKSYGMTYLGSSRTKKAEKIHKIPLTMNIGLGILAIECIILGVFSPFIIKKLILLMSESFSGINLNSSLFNINTELTKVSLILIAVVTIILIINKILSSKTKIVYSDTWGCGFVNQSNKMQYTSNAFSQPQTRLFAKVQGYSKNTKVSSVIHLSNNIFDICENYLYTPTLNIVNYISKKVVRIHLGKVRIYVLYIFIALTATTFTIYILL
ncbi:proton-conducting transporter transmembrane domain-containing protein [Helicovermis profundi]|uniref:Hydrogenase 4 subunit B n=1 Tax=Helicovermis profundi TaxID=3065157 RepID=A0AAU9EMF4_9FIRM|nr:hydrogenase 4 subunit B [Clostridia bacterium S502]